MNTRIETDSFGPIDVPADALWGAQTERSRRFFAIGHQRMPLALVHALAQVKRAAAEVNADLGLLPANVAAAIAAAAAKVAGGAHDAQFPLSVWQTGSGTQTNMNVNEVVARLATLALAAQPSGSDRRVHPNDDVNLGQSSNDVFPTAMHLAAVAGTVPLAAALQALREALAERAHAFAGIVKLGRTHLQDATPITFDQEFGAYVAQLGMAAAQGQLELNACKPLIAHDLLDSLQLLTDAMQSFRRHCVQGLQVDLARTAALVSQSLMLVTALVPHLGYDRAARIAHHAAAHGLDLRQAALALGEVSGEDFDAWVNVERMA